MNIKYKLIKNGAANSFTPLTEKGIPHVTPLKRGMHSLWIMGSQRELIDILIEGLYIFGDVLLILLLLSTAKLAVAP